MYDYGTNFIKAMTYDHPSEIPISSWILPAMWKKYGEELVQFAKEYPDFIHHIPDLNNLAAITPSTYMYGDHTDEWGCVWSNIEEGLESIVTGHPVPNREDILTLEVPNNTDGRIPHGLMYLRLLDLRGFEEAMMDFAEECEELQILIDKVLAYNCKQIEYALPRFDKHVTFGDDLGMQNGLAIGAEKWRKYMKPCFKKMFDIVHAAGKYVYLHTDGMIYEIIPDLIECGVTMLNPQYRANGLDNLVLTCKGKVSMNLDLDRQLFPFATPSQLDDHVREAVEALYMPAGGLGLSIELGPDVPLANAAALYDAARKYKVYKR